MHILFENYFVEMEYTSTFLNQVLPLKSAFFKS